MRELVPITLTDLKRYVNDYHEHNEAPTSWKFGVGIAEDGVLVGGGRAAALRQINRYVAYHEVSGLVLVTARVGHAAVPRVASGKPVRIVQLALQGL